MPPSKNDILYAIENSLVTRVNAPDVIWFDVEGIVGRYSPLVSYPLMNLVGKTNLTAENANATIQQVLSPFKKRNHMLGWIVNPSAKPDDLGKRLQDAGFVLALDGSGMYLTDLMYPIAANPDVMVRKATESDTDDVNRLYTEAYPMPADVTPIMMPFMSALGAANYLAFVKNEEKPVAIASMYYMPNSTIVALQGAATLEAYRGRRIYTSLLAQRLIDAHEDGMEVAIMQADRATSAPICKSLGFTELCDITVYVWMPSA
jgi:hypothetical protein